jgi:Kef-type K+ transport system membrane component KefB
MKSILLYLLLVGVPAFGVLEIIHAGHGTETSISAGSNMPGLNPDGTPLHLPLLLVQVAVILVLARAVGLVFRAIKQPQVIGEMVAGILLGPSVLGWISPTCSASLFPPGSLGSLNPLSQIGLVFYMFLVGLRLDRERLRSHRHTAFLTSHTSIVFPFTLGALLALYLYPRLSDGHSTFVAFALFLGTAMSVTAFPVLARILTDLKLLQTPVGTVTMACAAVDDVTAWCILASIVLQVRTMTATTPFWIMPLGVVLYTLTMLVGVRRALGKLDLIAVIEGGLSQNMLALFMILVIASASMTELLGIHALFGAFLMGVITPKDREFVRLLSEKLEGMTVVLLLPLFFAFTGLRTSIGLVSGSGMWFYCGLIIAVAILGKFGGSLLSARLNGLSWREAGAIGVLMNTRGLMELVVLNVGLDVGAISQTVFTMMVLMALVTTFMTTPLLEWIYPAWMRSKLPALVGTRSMFGKHPVSVKATSGN